MIAAVPVLALSPFGLAWIWTRMRRILPSTQEEIINRLYKGELERIREFFPHNNAIDILKTDPEYWRCVGGFKGIIRERENAVCCVQLCQAYVRDSNMDKQDVEYVSRRSFAIGFLVLASIPEQLIRLIWWGMPHFCGRWISYLYWELATHTSSLHLEYGTGKLAL